MLSAPQIESAQLGNPILSRGPDIKPDKFRDQNDKKDVDDTVKPSEDGFLSKLLGFWGF